MGEITILCVDLSFAKSGVAILKVKNREVSIEMAHLIKSDTAKSDTQRIDDTVTELKYIASKTNPKVVVKEESIVARQSTATKVLKTHGVYEHVLGSSYELDSVHNATIKAWARNVLKHSKKHTEADSKDKKKVVAFALEKYFGRTVEEIWTPRGALKDDVADAIALGIIWLEQSDYIDTKFKKVK